MVGDKGTHPLVGVLYHLLVHTVLVVLLHVSVKEKVETGDVGEGDVFCKGGALFVAKRFEELVVEVADLLLCDGGERVDRVEPSVELRVLRQLREACILELCCVLDTVDLPHEAGSAGQHVAIVLTEIIYVIAEVGLELHAVRALGVIGEGSEFAQEEVSGVEAL